MRPHDTARLKHAEVATLAFTRAIKETSVSVCYGRHTELADRSLTRVVRAVPNLPGRSAGGIYT